MNKLGKPQIQLSQTEPIVCEKCGGQVFEEAVMLRKVSPILTGTGQPGIVPIPVFACMECGHINKEFLPREVSETGNNA